MELYIYSLCNTKATSRQTLLLHAEGKKHGAKARAFHAAKQQPKDAKETKASVENNVSKENADIKDLVEPREPSSSKVATVHDGSGVENSSLQSSKKRKHEASETNGAQKKSGCVMPSELGNGEVIQVERAEKKIKWKKLITAALKSVRILMSFNIMFLNYL